MPGPRSLPTGCGGRSGPASGPPSAASRHSSRVTAPGLDSGSLPFPHLGDWMQDGQPAWHSQLRMASAVAASQSRAAW